ncbi:MAG: YggT family protein [Deltaproteobacteria bacterium]|nr:YggT family protein [Deltaproteobacteria bacterium]
MQDIITANIIFTVAKVLDMALNVYMWIIIARALVSWVNPDPYNPVVRFLSQVTEPVLGRLRRLLPYMGGVDVSPVIVIFAIFIVRQFLVTTLFDIAYRMKQGG